MNLQGKKLTQNNIMKTFENNLKLREEAPLTCNDCANKYVPTVRLVCRITGESVNRFHPKNACEHFEHK